MKVCFIFCKTKQESNMNFLHILDVIISGLTVTYEAKSQINDHFISLVLHSLE